jgi:ATP/maltotriose-dependent transcriptional regulator MalT
VAVRIVSAKNLPPVSHGTWEVSEQCRDGRDPAATQLSAILLAESLYEHGRLDDADNLLRPRMPAIRSSGCLECAARAYVVLARVSVHRGQRELALSLLRDARELGEQHRWSRLVALSTAEGCRLHLEDGNITAAEHSFRELLALVERSPAAPPAVQHAMRTQLTLLEFRLAIARGSCREPPSEDARILDLLPYTRSLLRYCDRTPVSEASQPLTQRESGVLQLIANGLSNKRIAQRLEITPETVKSHAKNIFFKLAAQTRAQAVARAEALRII